MRSCCANFVMIPIFLLSCGTGPSGEMRRVASVEPRGANSEGKTVLVPSDGIVNWNLLPCGSSQNTDALLEGGGTHTLIIQNPSLFKLQLQGRICRSSELMRHVVFLVDISSSVVDNPNNGTCERYLGIVDAVNTLSTSRQMAYSLITFNQEIVFASSKTSDGSTFLAQVVTPSRICGSSGMNRFDQAINKAAELILNENIPASSEVYLMAKSVPMTSQEQGLEAVASLKKLALLTTIYFGYGSDVLLRDIIASKDTDGRPLHQSVRKISDLGQALKNLSSSEIRGGQIIYRALGDSMTGVRVKLDSSTSDATFVIKYLEEYYNKGVDGLEVELDFWDQRAALYQSKGQILWKD